jgi:hypothetical protein
MITDDGGAMTTAIALLADGNRAFQELAAEVRNAHRSHLRELRLEVVLGGVILRGLATSYYGKQLALHEVRRRCSLLVVANRIEVEETAPNTVSLSDPIGG